MCGIAGFAAPLDPALTEVRSRALLDALRQRGPDGDSWAVHGEWALVQTRLAVIDLSERVRYPMGNETGDVWLVFNGEIYNHRELRSDLERAGHRFATACDAEVIVHGYEEWGEDIFARLSGMFAIALVDERDGSLLLARDRLGIKPLVYTETAGFAFASDALALVAAGLSGGAPDPVAIGEYLAFHYVPHPGTGLLDVRQLPPGAFMRRLPDGTQESRRWAPPPFSESEDGTPVTADELESALLAAVERHLHADVEVGILLSGGLDSRLVLAMAVAVGARPRTYTAAFPGFGDFDEAGAAARTADAFGVPNRTAEVDLDFESVVTGVANAFDQPFADASAIATLAVSRVAREEVTVALTGTGGDDLWAGYYRHRAHLLHPFASAVPGPVLERLAGLRGPRGDERRSVRTLARSYLARLAEAGTGDAFDQYLALVACHSSPVAIALVPAAADAAARTVAERLELRGPRATSTLRCIQAFEARTYLPGDLLTKEDRATMASGLEGRVPFLDLEILALAERAHDRQKRTLASGKRLLREVGRRWLGDTAAGGRKRGFAVPLHAMFAGAWRDDATAWLEASGGLVDGVRAAAALRSGSLPATDAWALAALTGWEQRLAEANSAAERFRLMPRG